MTTISTLVAGPIYPLDNYTTITSKGAVKGTAADGVIFQATTSSPTLVNGGLIQTYYLPFRHNNPAGVFMGAGTLINTGVINSYAFGLQGGTGLVDLVNSGTFTGVEQNSVYDVFYNDLSVSLGAGGVVTNLPSGVIGYGISLGANSTLINEGVIDGSLANYQPHARGAWFNGYVVNGVNAQINGYIYGSGTVVNAGTIGYGTGSGLAVSFRFGTASTLVLYPGSVLRGGAWGGNAIGSTVTSSLVFASAAGRGMVTSNVFSEFGQITVASGANWTVGGGNSLMAGQYLHQGGWLAIAGSFNSAGMVTATGQTALYSSGGTITNSGTIIGASNIGVELVGASLGDSGFVGGGSYGVILANDAGVSVAAGGTVSGNTGIEGWGTVTVAGEVIGTSATADQAIAFETGVTSHLVIDPGAVFVGQVYGGYREHARPQSELEFASGTEAGTLGGLGSQYQSFASVTIDSGAVWTAAGANTLGTYAALIVAGTLDVDGAGYSALGIEGTMTVAAGGRLTGPDLLGAQLTAGGSLMVAGTIAAADYGAYAFSGSTITNSGVVSGQRYGVGIDGGALVNSGMIQSGFYGVYDRSGKDSTITNLAGGTISGEFGVGAAGGVYNAGTIAAGTTSNNALTIHTGYAGQVTVAPGAVFIGAVNGGNTVGSGVTSSLVFAAGTADGTFSGLGTQYLNFGQITIAAGGTWTLTGSNMILAGQTLVALGALDLDGGLTVLGSFSHTGGLTLADGSFVIGDTETGVTYGAVATDEILSIASGGRVFATGTIPAVGPVPAGVRLTTSTFFNSGYVGSQDYGALGGAFIDNYADATISGGRIGVSSHGTLINAGLIAGYGTGTSVAVTLAEGSPNVVVVEPGASFAGLVDGGNAIGATAASTLVFGGHTAQGTFSGLGSHYVDFRYVSIGQYAFWQAAGDNTLLAGQTLSLLGAVSIAGSFENQGLVTTPVPVTTTVGGGFGMVANGYGISLLSGSRLVNDAGARLYGELYGVAGNGTVVNAGTIGHYFGSVGEFPGSGYAVTFAPGAGNRLVVDPGAVFDGAVGGGNTYGATAQSVLELASGAAAGTLVGFNSEFANFASVTVDSGANWTVTGIGNLEGETIADAGTLSLAGSQEFSGTIAFEGAGRTLGFATYGVDVPQFLGLAHNTIELVGVAQTEVGYYGGLLTLTGGDLLKLGGSYALDQVSVTDAGGNTYITACFASGTSILTPGGARAVETLRAGEMVLTASGRLAPVRWVGHRRTDLRRHTRPHDVMPVRVTQGAFGPSRPSKDLVLSPDHAVLVDGALIPIRHLINGGSIRQEKRASVTYWHIELDRHDVVLAEGLACETYLDTGNRAAFEGEAAVQLHPAFARAVWAEAGCAPILTDPADAALRAVHLRLLARARVPVGALRVASD
jgi:hypothetical protein